MARGAARGQDREVSVEAGVSKLCTWTPLPPANTFSCLRLMGEFMQKGLGPEECLSLQNSFVHRQQHGWEQG